MPIATDRLILRPWEDADAPALYTLAKDPQVGPAAGWLPHESAAQSLAIIQTVLRAPESYAIELRGSRTLVGAIALKDAAHSDLVQSDRERELGYWIGRPHWGQGLAPEATRALIEHGRRDLGLSRIWAAHYTENVRSRRVMETCGLTFVQTRRHVPVPLLGPHVFRDEDVLAIDFG